MNRLYEKCFEKFCKMELEGDVTFSFRGIEEIREGDVAYI